MKNILLLAAIALIGTAAHAQKAPGSDQNNELIGTSQTKSDTQAAAAVVGDSKCPQCELKNLSPAKMMDKTAAPARGSGSTDSSGAQGQSGAQ